MTITKDRKQEVIQQFKQSDDDTGSADIQIAVLTERINGLTQHMKSNKKDFACQRGLLAMVSRRRRLLDYVKKHDPQRYVDLLQTLGVRK